MSETQKYLIHNKPGLLLLKPGEVYHRCIYNFPYRIVNFRLSMMDRFPLPEWLILDRHFTVRFIVKLIIWIGQPSGMVYLSGHLQYVVFPLCT